MKRLSVSSSRSMVRAELIARLGVEILAQQQARTVADVLDRVGEIVNQAGGDTAEHRVPLLPLYFFLQLDELIRHRVERSAEISELVVPVDGDARLELSGGDVVRAALELEDRIDEAAAEQIADGDHAEQGDRDGDAELALQHGGVRVGFSSWLLDDHGPAQRGDAGCDTELAAAVFVGVFLRHRRSVRAGPRGCEQLMAAHVARLGDERFLVGIAVRDQFTARPDDLRVSRFADADLIDHPPHLFEAELAGEPAGGLIQVREPDREHRGRQHVLVDPDWRHRRRRRCSVLRSWESSLAATPTRLVATIAPCSSNSVISRNSRNCRT